MATDAALLAYFERLAAAAGTPALDAVEADAILDLARVIAHTSERHYAPLGAYVAGLALASETDVSERVTWLRGLIDAVRAKAAVDQA